MRAQAMSDGAVYLPNLEPAAPVQAVVICMEPSLGRWAQNNQEAQRKIDQDGFRNFVDGIDTQLLHAGLKLYLMRPGQRYHLTDISKGAMPVAQANLDRSDRYDRWYRLLLDEIELVASAGAHIIAVGQEVARYLQARSFGPRPVVPVMHYSPLAGAARRKLLGEAGFVQFKQALDAAAVLSVVRGILEEMPIGASFRQRAIERLSKTALTNSRLALLYSYKLAFERIRDSAEN